MDRFGIRMRLNLHAMDSVAADSIELCCHYCRSIDYTPVIADFIIRLATQYFAS